MRPDHVAHHTSDVLDDDEREVAGAGQARPRVGGELGVHRLAGGQPAREVADVGAGTHGEAGQPRHAPCGLPGGPVGHQGRGRAQHRGRPLKAVLQAVVGDGSGGPEQRGRGDRVREDALEALVPVPAAGGPARDVGERGLLVLQVDAHLPQDVLVVVVAAALAQVGDPVAAALRRQSRVPAGEPRPALGDPLPQVQDQREPAGRGHLLQHLPQVPREHRRRSAGGEVDAFGRLQDEHPFELLGAEDVAGRGRQVQRRPAPLLGGPRGGRADRPGDRGAEERDEHPGPLAEAVRAVEADGPERGQDGVPLVPARPVQPRGTEPAAKVDARARGDGAPVGDEHRQLPDGVRHVPGRSPLGSQRDGRPRPRVRLVQQPSRSGGPGDPGMAPGRHHSPRKPDLHSPHLPPGGRTGQRISPHPATRVVF